MCLACSATCHEGHPVCFLNIPAELKFAKCLCGEIDGNACKLAKEQAQKAGNIFGRPPKDVKDLPLIKPPGKSALGNPPP